MAAEGIPLMASAILTALTLAALSAALAISPARSAYIRLGLLSSIRRMASVRYQSLTVALIAAVIFASLSIGDGLKARVTENVERNMSDVGIIVEYPDPIRPETGSLEMLIGRGIHPALILEGSARSATASTRVRVIGAEVDILDLLPMKGSGGGFLSGTSAYVNRKASERLGVSPGDNLELRIPLPHPRTIAGISLSSLTLDVPVSTVVEDSGLGRFRSDSRDEAPHIIIMERGHLSRLMGDEGAVNAFLCRSDLSKTDIITAFNEAIGPTDIGYSIAELEGGSLVMNELFMFPKAPFGDPVLSYFVDGLASDNASIPYSTTVGIAVTTMGVDPPPIGGAIVSSEAASRLGIGPGDDLTIAARVLDAYGNLVPVEFELTVSRVLPVEALIPLGALVPPIPGITDRESCSDWSPPFSIDLDLITDEDLSYWEDLRTTPRLIMNLNDAQDSFRNPYGDVTGILSEATVEEVQLLLEEHISSSVEDGGITSGGGRIVEARSMALGSDRALSIFPLMFLTFGSVIIIGACLTLLGILRGRYLRMAGEWANARAIGMRRSGLMMVAVLDSFPALVLGSALGIPLGYALFALLKLMLGGAWSNAVEGYGIPVVFDPHTALFSVLSGALVSGAVIVAISLREALRAPDQVSRGADLSIREGGKSRYALPAAGMSLSVLGIGMLLLTASTRSNLALSMLHVLGSAALASGIALIIVSAIPVRDHGPVRLVGTANIGRRPGLAPLVTAILAMIVAVSISLAAVGQGLGSRIDSDAGDYGGGYDHIAELSITNRDPLSQAVSELGDRGYSVAELYAVGDEGGTCSNINAPYPPRLLGIPDGIRFDLVRWDGAGEDEVWGGLGEFRGDSVPILVDENTLTWIYYEDLGSVFSVINERGEEMRMVVVGVLSPSVLTGSFVMSRDMLVSNFPRVSRPSILLIKEPPSGGSLAFLEEVLRPLGPDISSTLDLGRENMRYELGFLSIFNQFLIVGIASGLISAAAFTVARARERTTDIYLLHSLGMTKKRIRASLVLENMLSFAPAVSCAFLVGTVAAMLSPATGNIDPLGSVSAPAIIAIVVMVTAFCISLLGSCSATSGKIRRRRDS